MGGMAAAANHWLSGSFLGSDIDQHRDPQRVKGGLQDRVDLRVCLIEGDGTGRAGGGEVVTAALSRSRGNSESSGWYLRALSERRGGIIFTGPIFSRIKVLGTLVTPKFVLLTRLLLLGNTVIR